MVAGPRLRDRRQSPTADRRPPTNVHVLIGRNNVGKSHLLRNLVSAVCDRRAREADVGSVVHRDQPGPSGFLGVVAVSFSVFDRFVAIPKADQLIPYTHVGAHEPVDDDTDDEATARPLRRGELAERFAESVEACLTGRVADRWARAISTLRYSGSGFLEDDTWVPRFLAAGADARRQMAKELFKRLSHDPWIGFGLIVWLDEVGADRFGAWLCCWSVQRARFLVGGRGAVMF